MFDRHRLDSEIIVLAEEINATSGRLDSLIARFKQMVEARDAWNEGRAVIVDASLATPCVVGTKRPLALCLTSRRIGEPSYLTEKAAAPAKMPAIAGFDPERIDREGLMRLRGHLRLLQSEAARPGAINAAMLREQAAHTQNQIALVEARLSPKEIEESKHMQLNKTSYTRLPVPVAVDSMGNPLPAA